MAVDTEDIPDEVYEEYKQVRQSGAVNMMDRNGVQSVAYNKGCYRLVTWIEEHSGRDYSRLLHGYDDWAEGNLE